MIPDCVDDDVNTRITASGYHIPELITASSLALDKVGHFLVGRPPLVALDVLRGGGHLNDLVASRTKKIGAFSGDGIPTPFKKVNDDR
jgi:hypothetical protein